MYRWPVCDFGIFGDSSSDELSSRIGKRFVDLGLECIPYFQMIGTGSFEFNRD